VTSRIARRLKIAISLMLVAGLFYFLDLASLATALKNIDTRLLLVAFLMVICNRVLMPVKWNLLLRARGIHVSNWTAVRMYTLSSFLGLVLPPTVGADSVRSYYMKKEGIKLSDTVASILIERILGLVVLLGFTIASFVLLVHLLRSGDIDVATFTALLTVLSVIMLAAVYLSFTPLFQRLASKFAVRLQGTRLSRAATGIDSLVQAYQEYRHQKSVLMVFSALTVVELSIVILRSYVVALSLGVDLSIAVFFAFLPLVTLLNRMPISFDGFGINEALFVYFLALFGVPPEQGFLIGLINHLLFIIGILPGGLFYVQAGRDRPRP
jgi:hypothetical protein